MLEPRRLSKLWQMPRRCYDDFLGDSKQFLGKQLVWDITVVYALAPKHLNQDCLLSPGAIDSESRKLERFHGLVDNGYIFSTGVVGERSSVITRLCKLLCRSHDDQRTGFANKQCGICSRNSERQNVLFVGTAFHLCFCNSTTSLFFVVVVVLCLLFRFLLFADHGCMSSPPK